MSCAEFRRPKHLEDFTAGAENEIEVDRERNWEKAYLKWIAQYAKVPVAVPQKQTVKR